MVTIQNASYFFCNDVLYHVKNNSDRWLHVVFTYDGGSSGVSNGVVGLARKVYMNGEECLVESDRGYYRSTESPIDIAIRITWVGRRVARSKS